MEDMVRLKGVSKSYRMVQALTGVDLGIRQGEVFGYIGPNGAGKTTTIRIMVGLISDYQGEVTVAGRSTRDGDVEAKRLVGYMPQRAGFQEWRTVEQALVTFGRLSGMGQAEVMARITELLDQLGIAEYRRRRITQLSGGTLQKVGMAQALLHDPKLLVLDEPVAGLDPEARYNFKLLLRDLRRHGKTIFFSSHILSDMEDLADRIGILSAGRLVHVGTMEDLKAQVRTSSEVLVELSLDQGGMRALEAVPGVASVKELRQASYCVTLSPGADMDSCIHAMLAGLMASGSRVRSIRPDTPSLERLYVDYLAKGVGL
jgi:ABC-2 type transport system ATP-binding protein